jgi:hypothetical protein
MIDIDQLASDYAVLEEMRNTDVPEALTSFHTALWWIWAARQDADQKAGGRSIGEGWGAMPTYYQPGDYREACQRVIADGAAFTPKPAVKQAIIGALGDAHYFGVHLPAPVGAAEVKE